MTTTHGTIGRGQRTLTGMASWHADATIPAHDGQTKQTQARGVISESTRPSHLFGAVRFGRHEPVWLCDHVGYSHDQQPRVDRRRTLAATETSEQGLFLTGLIN